MNGVNFQQLKKLDKSNVFVSNLLNKIRLFLENSIDRVEVAGSSPVGITKVRSLKSLRIKGFKLFVFYSRHSK
ncbi:hypothetical protein SAMN05192569_100516 [Parageobacillus thermantarcticus]|uniref:Uncharacterized protein n=1 Tax=Parageobacillus thermantarcticus TaxID=186116 RepID=A0A1I0STS9_9BACL|nr:hypothetical protein SAMN05192569_100516 [Parageobacillus thermantarcticus]